MYVLVRYDERTVEGKVNVVILTVAYNKFEIFDVLTLLKKHVISDVKVFQYIKSIVGRS